MERQVQQQLQQQQHVDDVSDDVRRCGPRRPGTETAQPHHLSSPAVSDSGARGMEEGAATAEQERQQGFAAALDFDRSPSFSLALILDSTAAIAALDDKNTAEVVAAGGGGVGGGFASVLDHRQRQARCGLVCCTAITSKCHYPRWYCARYPCCANQERTSWTLGLFVFVTFTVVFYFTVPWVPVLEDLLDWIDKKGPRGILLLFVLHQLALYSIVGPINTLEYCWVFLRGWSAVPLILLSYIVAIAVMLFVGNTVLRPCLLRRLRDNRLMQATQRVLDEHPYAWYVAFQFWSIVPWRVGVYCAHVLAPHANLVGIGAAVLLGQLPYLLYGIFLATKITNLNSLVTLRLDTPRDTAIFWSSVVVTFSISLLLYVKIKRAFVEAASRSAGPPRRELEPDITATGMSLTPMNQATTTVDP